MIRSLVCTAVVALGLAAATVVIAPAQAQALRVGTEGAFPPFNFVGSDGKLQGFEIDMANEVCRVAKRQCTFTSLDFDGLIPGLLAEKFDVIIGSMSITDQRAQRIDFSRPYYKVPARFVAKRGSQLDASEASLANKRVGVVSGTTSERYFSANWAKIARQVTYPKLDDALLDLQSERLDAVLDTGLSIEESFLKKPAGANFAFTGPRISDPKFYGQGVGVGVRKGDKATLDLVNAALVAIVDDGTFRKLSEKYFGYDISPVQ